MSSFASRLIRWQKHHGRHDLPWQGADAYHVWLSEIMLQQTQVATVIPYYQRFVASFPTASALAAATEDQILAHWSGLGYYARGRNLHAAAQFIVEKYQGEFPREIEQILELPGIGRSTAAAICALAYHERCAILDGNVKRVLARYCGIEGWAGDKKVEAQLWRQAEEFLPPPSSRGNDIATYTQAIMDLGATICTRSKPHCPACPVQSDCVGLKTNRIANLPALGPKKPLPEKHAVFLLLMHGNDILLEKRPGSGIWGGLWCPPQFDDKAAALAWCEQRRIESVSGKVSNHERDREAPLPFAHTFTHFKLHITPMLLRLKHKPQQVRQLGSIWLDVKDALQGAIPTPVRRMLAGMKNAKNGLISSMHKNNWVCYLLECVDGTLYCGITYDLDKRLASHNAGEGAKYTRGRAPVKLVYVEHCADKSAALKREIEIKDLPRAQKLMLCELTETVENR